ncbi:hypothetical protein P3S67_003967 [Capsicum chacoense]
MKESKIVEVFIQAQNETYYQYLLPALGKPFIEVLKMGEMIEDEIKFDRIMSFATLKATTQAIQKGSGSVGEKKNKKDASTIVFISENGIGGHDYSSPWAHCYPGSRNFDPNARCAYHSDVQDHSIEDYRYLKREIEKMIQDRSIMMQNIDNEESSSHADMKIDS